jgi:hypothetical protein
VSEGGPKTTLSIFTAATAVEEWSFALTLGDPASSRRIAIITGAVKLATHTIFLFMILFLFWM